MNHTAENTLQRGLSNRHVQLIALGGSVGTGLFLGTAATINMAGPSVLLGYALGGVIAFLIMRQLGEMVVEEPVAGSFSHFACRYWGEFAGFLSGWNYWALYVLVGMAELTAVGVYVQFWWPQIPSWVSALVFFVFINAINLFNVRMYGEMEFWFSIIKVSAIMAMIGFGSWLLASGNGGPQAAVSNLWALGGFFPNGVNGLVMAMAIIMFSFGGLELVGITAAEVRHPEQTIPKATNQLIYRILIFYIGALGVLLALYPWNQVSEIGSPFVLIFHHLDTGWVATALNIIVLTAALSVYNSGVYCKIIRARGAGGRFGGLSGGHCAVCRGQLPDSRRGAGDFDESGGRGIGHQLGDDYHHPFEIPPALGKERAAGGVCQPRRAAHQWHLPGLCRRDFGGDGADTRDSHRTAADSGMGVAAGRSVCPALAAGKLNKTIPATSTELRLLR